MYSMTVKWLGLQIKYRPQTKFEFTRFNKNGMALFKGFRQMESIVFNITKEEHRLKIWERWAI